MRSPDDSGCAKPCGITGFDRRPQISGSGQMREHQQTQPAPYPIAIGKVAVSLELRPFVVGTPLRHRQTLDRSRLPGRGLDGARTATR